MAKSSGLGAGLFVSGNDLSGDVGQVNTISKPTGTLPLTGIDKSAMERAHAAKSGQINFTSWFNDAAGQAHPVLSALPTTNRLVTYCHRKTAVGDSAASMIGFQIGYDPNRGADGSLAITVDALANGFGLEWGQALTPGIRTDSGATNGASHDYGAAIGQTSFGAQAYLHVFSFTGTSATVTVEDSANDSTWATLATFATVTGQTSERIATSTTETVDRYLRVATSGTFSDLQFWVQVVKNQSAAEALF